MSPDPILDLGDIGKRLYRGAGKAARSAPVSRLVRRRTPIRDLADRRYAGRFADSNRALAEMCPELDLRGYQGIGQDGEAGTEHRSGA